MNSFNFKNAIFIGAFMYNFSILKFNRFFTNEKFSKVDSLFDFNGQVLVLVWGLCYLSVTWSYASTPYTILVFALEKLFYTAHYIQWHTREANEIQCTSSPSLTDEHDANTRAFFRLYGIGDGIFCLRFIGIFTTSVY